MAQDTVTKCFGLISQYNSLAIAKGALIKADNANIRRENVIENRRGYKVYGTLSSAPKQFMIYQNRVLVHNGTAISYDNGSGTFANYSGSYSAPTGRKMRYELDKSNLYVTTSLGIKVVQDLAGTAARSAGAPRSLDLSYSTTGATGFLANNFQAAYRCIFKRQDLNGNTLIGYPSQRLWVTNSSGGTRNISLTTYLPNDALAGDEVQFYRTAQVTGVASDSAGDEMGLVFSYTLVAADITAGFITVTDSIVDELRGETLYTSPSQEGIEGANERPPLSQDIALFKSNFMFYANTQTRQRLFITLVGTSGLTGNTITIAGTTYNFGASEIISGGGSPQVLVSATGTAAVDIDMTARSLVRVINRYASNTSVYAYYLSGSEDLPGQILLESRVLGSAAFTALASNSAISLMYNPPPPVGTPNAKSTSSNEVATNGLYYSKFQQPEAVPLANVLKVGPNNTNIRRIAALRDSLIIIKDEGVYRLTGEDPNSFSVTPLDLTVGCKADDSVVVLNNEVYMFVNEGIVRVSDTGVEVVSRAIEPELSQFPTFSTINSTCYGIAYESDKSYMVSVPTVSGDTGANQQFVYNTFTRCWTKFTFGVSSGIHEPEGDKLYFSLPDDVNVYQERKTFTNEDYVDPEKDITITALNTSTNQVTFTLVTGSPIAGWVIEQGSTRIVCTAISLVSGTTWIATLLTVIPFDWVTGAAKIYPGTNMDIQWATWTADQPGLIKQVRQAEILADNITGNNSASSVVITFSTDIAENDESVDVVTNSSSWGISPWGGFGWGGTKDNSGYPTYVPRYQQYCRLMNPGVQFNNGNEKLSITGIVLTYEMISERTGK